MPPLRDPSPPLADARVALRAMHDGDVAWIARESRDPLVPRYTTVPEDNSEEDVHAFLLAQRGLRERGEQLHLLAVEVATGERIGPVGLHHLSWEHRRAEVGYWAAAGMRGRGLTSAAVRLLCAWAFAEHALERIELRADAENAASLRVAETCGFVREGTLRSAERTPRGRRDVALFGLLPGELTSR